MKRLALLVLALAAFAPATANAAVPCRDKIYNDWYGDGKIATTYAPSCYRAALKHIPADARTYSSLADDIRSALQGALRREHGSTNVPAQVGKGGNGGVEGVTKTLKPSKQRVSRTTSTPRVQTTPSDQQQTTIAAPSSSTDGSSGIPTPILILGALALLLAAAGAVGAGLKHRRR